MTNWAILFISALLVSFGCAHRPIPTSREYTFTTDWFTPKIPVWQKILAEFQGRRSVHYLELGVYEGRSFFWTMDNILTDPSSSGTAVDTFSGGLMETFKRNLKASGHERRVAVVQGRFNEVLQKFPKESFDLIYLDGGHMAWATLETAILAWPLLKRNGVLIFDDYRLEEGTWPAELTPKPAVDGFLATHKNFIEVLHKDYQLIVRKVRTSCLKKTSYACTPILDWAYFWDSKILLSAESGREFQLSGEQIKTLERILIRHQGPNDLAQTQRAMAQDPEFEKFTRALAR